MNIQDYIASGVLESYVMGELTDQEMRKVECMALVHDEISQELKQIEETFEQMSMDTAVKPSDSLKKSIWADIQKDLKEEAPIHPIAQADSTVPPSSTNFSWGRAASIAAILGLTGFGYLNYQENQELASLVSNQQSQQEALDKKLTESDALLAQMNAEMSVLKSARFTSVKLSGTENSPRALAKVFWDAKSSEVYLSVDEMAELPAGKVYQLWALDGGNPVDAGTFTPGDSLIKMKSILSGQAFAVTIEDEGGAILPALETLQVIGNVPV